MVNRTTTRTKTSIVDTRVSTELNMDMAVDDSGRVRPLEDIMKERKAKCLCEHCGITRTHKRNGVGFKKPITSEEVWQGYCLKCYKIEKKNDEESIPVLKSCVRGGSESSQSGESGTTSRTSKSRTRRSAAPSTGRPGGSGQRATRSSAPVAGGSGQRATRSSAPVAGGSGQRATRSSAPVAGGSGQRTTRSSAPVAGNRPNRRPVPSKIREENSIPESKPVMGATGSVRSRDSGGSRDTGASRASRQPGDRSRGGDAGPRPQKDLSAKFKSKARMAGRLHGMGGHGAPPSEVGADMSNKTGTTINVSSSNMSVISDVTTDTSENSRNRGSREGGVLGMSTVSEVPTRVYSEAFELIMNKNRPAVDKVEAYHTVRNIRIEAEDLAHHQNHAMTNVIVAMFEDLRMDEYRLHPLACSVMWRFAVMKESIKIGIGASSGIKTLLIALRINAGGDDDTRVWACGAISSLYMHDRNRSRSVKEVKEAMTELSNIMKEDRWKSVQRGEVAKICALRAYWSLYIDAYTAEESNVDAFFAIRSALNNVTKNSNPNLVEWSLRVLVRLAPLVKEKQLRGLVDTIAQCMTDFPNSRSLHYHACSIILLINVIDTEGLAVAPLIVKALKRFPRCGQLRERGCAALSKLCQKAWARSAVVKAGGIKAIVAKEDVMKVKMPWNQEAIDAVTILFEGCCGRDSLPNAVKKNISFVSDFVLQLQELEYDKDDTIHTAVLNLMINMCLVLHGPYIDDVTNQKSIILAIMKIMGKFKDDEEYQEVACSALAALAAASDENKRSIVIDSEMMKYVYMAMKHHVESENIQEKIYGLLSSLSESDYEFPPSQITNLADAFRRHNNSCRVQTNICNAICNIALRCNERDCKEMTDLVGDIVDGMETHLNSVEFQEAACSVLCSLSALSTSDTSGILTEGKMDIINKVLTTYPQSISISCNICTLYYNCTIKTQLSTLEYGVFERGFNFLFSSIANPCLQNNHEFNEMAFKILCSWTKRDDAIMAAIYMPNSLDTLKDAILRFGESNVITSYTLSTLGNVMVDEFKHQIVTELLVDIIRLMKTFSKDEMIQQAGMTLLGHLIPVCHEDSVRELGIIKLVIDIMDSYPENLSIQEDGVPMINNYTFKGDNAIRELTYLGGIKVLIQNIHKHPGSLIVVNEGITALWSISDDENAKRAIGDLRGCDAVINGMLTHLENEHVQKNAMGLITSLATFSYNKTLVKSAGGKDAIVYAMQAYFNDSEIQDKACHALASIAVDVSKGEVSAITPDELSTIVMAMQIHEQYEDFQQKACILMKNYTCNPDNIDIMRSNYDLQVRLQTASNLFPDSCEDRAMVVIETLQG